MAITFRAATASSGSLVTTVNVTIPAGVAAGDVVIVAASGANSTSSTTFTASSTGTAPTQMGTTAVTNSGSTYVFLANWYFVASATDAGKVVTITASVSAYMGIIVSAYTGVNNSSPVDVLGTPTTGDVVTSLNYPSVTTTNPDDWAVYTASISTSSTSVTTNAGYVTRATSSLSSNPVTTLCDTGGSAGGSGVAATGTITLPSSAIMVLQTITLNAASTGPVLQRGAPVLTAGAASNSLTVTSAWGSGQVPAAGDLLAAVVSAYGTTTIALGSAPAGWSLLLSVSTPATATTVCAIYTATAAGGDTAPAFTATATGTAADAAITATLHDFYAAGGAVTAGAQGTATGTSGTITATTSTAVAAAGGYGLAITECSQGTSAATTKWTPPANWGTGGAQLASARAQTATYFLAQPPSGSTLSAIFTHTRTSTEQVAAMVALLPPASPPPLAPVAILAAVSRAANW